MSKILLRAAQSPFDNFTGFQTFVYDKIWSNLGNLLFSHSVYKTLYSKDTKIDIMNRGAAEYRAESINENYDAMVLPFANAFRSDFAQKLQAYTDLIQKLTIPVVVTGIGMQAPVENIKGVEFDFDPVVKDFMKAVLEHSTSVGVRGKYTYDYLCRLGFKDHVRIIGCPSMYMFGDTLPQQHEKVAHDQFSVNLNSKRADSLNMKLYLFGLNEKKTFIPQTTRELELLYSGKAIVPSEQYYPTKLNSRIFEHTSVRFPVSVKKWFETLQMSSMSIGTRIHGSVASVLSGLPTYVICTDSRVLELAEYHEIPHCLEKDFDFSKPVYELYENVDFSAVYKNHKSRYENYVSFMEENGLTVQKTPFTDFYEIFDTIEWNRPIIPLTEVSRDEMLHRLNAYYKRMNDEKRVLKKRIENLSEKLNSD